MEGLNLRGRRVRFMFNGKERRGTVITHLRNGLWQVSSGGLPLKYQRPDMSRRITLKRAEFSVVGLDC